MMMKIQKDLEYTKEAYPIRIANHLITLSKEDPSIKEDISREDKSLKEMWEYIGSEICKKAMEKPEYFNAGNSKRAVGYCGEDEEIYGLAIHYYHESNDSLGIKKEVSKKIVKEEKKVEITLPKEVDDDFDI